MKPLGRSGLNISALGLGCMTMSDFYEDMATEAGRKAGEAQALATIEHALQRGINFLDSADVYGIGHNEELVGRAVQAWVANGGQRSDVVLATKFGNVRHADGSWHGVNGRPEYVHAACAASLQRLGLDHIDLYYQHRVDPETPIEETVGAMAELVVEGKVRALGLSEASVDTLRRANAVHPISALQSEYSLWSRDVEAGQVAACRELDITFVAYSPLGRGFLTGAYAADADLADHDSRRNHPRFQAGNIERNRAALEEIHALAQRKGCTPAQLALAWLLHQGDHIVPIPGTKRSARIDENLGALDVELTAAELAELDRLAAPGTFAGTRYPELGMKRVNI
jgi:aryl-alcohol dehydrogenase-like predicted oxidoreductase